MRGREGRRLLRELLYPRRCPVCHGIAPEGRRICPACEAALPRIRPPRCGKCGRPVEGWEICCRDCAGLPRHFDQGVGVFLYDDAMRRTIIRFKYKGRYEYGEPLGNCMAREAREALLAWRPQAVAPVPLHPGRLAARGFNQAEALARPVAAACGAQLLPELLMRTGKTPVLKRLGAGERRRRTRGAFALGPGARPPGRVLLIDDIFTTGATIDACAEALKAGGAERVYFLTLCIGGGAAARF